MSKNKQTVLVAHINASKYSETFIHTLVRELHKKKYCVFEAFGGYRATHFRKSVEVQIKKIVPPGILKCDKLLTVFLDKDVHYFHDYWIKKFLKKEKIEFVIAQYGPVGAALAPLCSKLKIPFIVHFHGFDIYKNNIRNKYILQYKSFFKSASKIVVTTQDMKQKLLDIGASEEKLIMNPVGVDTKRFHGAEPKESAPIFLWFGRFVMKKGPHLTLLAFSKVVKKHREAQLIFVGDNDGSELYEVVQDLITGLNLESNVRISGAKTQDELIMLMKKARGYIQHFITAPDGDTEGPSLVVEEASSMGLPVIATNHGGIVETVIHKKTGYLVNEKDVDGMAEYIEAIIKDPCLSEKLGKNGREHMKENYSLNKYINNMMSIINSQ